MRVISKMVLAALAMGALTTSASAAVNIASSHPFDPAGTRLGTGESLVWNFNTVFNPVADSHFTYNGQVHVGTVANFWAAPANDTSHYGIATDIGPIHDATFTIQSGFELTSFSAYLGSLDDYNSISFLSNGSTVQTYSGNQLAQFAAGHNADHSTTSGDSNARFFFTFDAADDITQVLFHSNGRAFEFDNFAASFISTVPEPATWAMMILGFGFIGFMMRSNRAKTATISA